MVIMIIHYPGGYYDHPDGYYHHPGGYYYHPGGSYDLLLLLSTSAIWHLTNDNFLFDK